MQDMELLYTPVGQLRQLLDARQITSAELTELYLRRISSLNPKLNAFLTVTAEQAMALAHAADQQIRDGQTRKPLLGIPISIKDLEVTKGIRTTLGSLVFQDTVPEIDSVVAERVRASGAILLGKTIRPNLGSKAPLRTAWATLAATRGTWSAPAEVPAAEPVRPWLRECAPSPPVPMVEDPSGIRAVFAACLASNPRWDGCRGLEVWAGLRPISHPSRAQ